LDETAQTPAILPAEMAEFIRYAGKYSCVPPRTYWCELPFFVMIRQAKQHYTLGYRPQDLSKLDTIEQKAWRKHKAHLNRLERFPLEKAEYYQRLKEAHGITTVRGLARITGEDWSHIAKTLRMLDLAQPIRDFLLKNKEAPAIARHFTFRRLLDIVRQGDERNQVARFREEILNQG
jgi:hypothetical protein